jgi:cobaltochelatase CobN
MRRLLQFLALVFAPLLTAAAMSAPALAAEPSSTVRVVTTDFVLPGKITRLDQWARPHGLSVEGLYADKDPRGPGDWGAQAGLVVLDTPRGNDLAAVMARAGDALDSARTPWLRVGGGPPAWGGGLPPEVARRLAGYYGNGGKANLDLFFQAYLLWRAGGDLSTLPPAQALPKAGVYHPDAPAAFADASAYLAWGQGRWPKDAPRLGVISYSGALASGETGLLDAFVRSAEARGVVPVVFWFDAGDPDGIGRIARAARLDALVNLQHLQNGPARKAEFEALNIPVTAGFVSREGDIAAWRASTTGIAPQTTAALLATPEGWGVSDPMVVGAIEAGDPTAIPAQVDAVIAKAARLARLKRLPEADKRLALMFWNHPGGEKNLGASNLNVPRSLATLTEQLAAAGYDVPPTDEKTLIADAQAMLGGYYRPGTLDDLLARGLAQAFPLEAYQTWLDRQPAAVREAVTRRWGAPQDHWAVRAVDGRKVFVIPRLELGKLTILPQPPRADRVGEAYHDTKVAPGHLYLATYLMVREGLAADALIHFGTHGTQEWTPGKDRGLSVEDFPFLAVGDLPVFYPYIQDNVSEAIQARRRGRAVTISHQTPPFAPAGLYDELRDLHGLLHEYAQLDEGPVQLRTADQIRTLAMSSGLARDMGWTPERMTGEFPAFLAVLHDHLHALAATATPLGLHTFGEPASPALRAATVMQQLGEPYYRRLGLDPKEVFAEDAAQLQGSPAYALVARRLAAPGPLPDVADPELAAMLERAVLLDRNLAQTGEMEALLAGLDGGFVRAGAGGDPIRDPEVTSGRNLYAFEPDKLPTRAAYAAGRDAFDQLYRAYVERHGKPPTKLAFSLWSGEAIRSLGVIEGQALYAMGLRPVWDQAGRVTELEIIPAAELGRPRVDAVLQVTSVYRDQFDGFMRRWGKALKALSALDEPGNAVADNSARLEAELVASGVEPARARRLAAVRLFGNAPGDYGTGVPQAAMASTTWKDERELADRFMERLQYAYDDEAWGERPTERNLFAAQLKGVQAAVLSRSSNLNGVLSTDHPFEYLGGLSAAVRRLDGANPELFITDARAAQPRVRGAAEVLSDEMRGRYLNPQWITAMKGEGYAGTLEVLDMANNLFGWQAMDRSMVRADQWQAIHDTFVMDRRRLGVNAWFEADNPTAQAQMIERMAEAVRKGYWRPDARTLREMAQRWRDLKAKGAQTGASETAAVLDGALAGFGRSGKARAAGRPAPPAPAKAAAAAPAPPDARPVRGRVLEKVSPPAPPQPRPPGVWLGLLVLAAFFILGAARQLFLNPDTALEARHAKS